MKIKWIALLLILCLLLCSCSSMGGVFVSVTPHQEKIYQGGTAMASASYYLELRTVLAKLVEEGRSSGVIDVSGYDPDQLSDGITMAVQYARDQYPIGAYAVESIDCELGTSGGSPALAVEISYRLSSTQIRRIQRVADTEAAQKRIQESLQQCSGSLVLLVEKYDEADFTQYVYDFALNNPDTVMEYPLVTLDVYPKSGSSRVVELLFSYETSREALRQMQEKVKPIFSSAALYVSGDGGEHQKLSQLYSFLMERFDYKLETSITPTYSLLLHGVGDSKAFATTFAAMCRRAGQEAMVILGTRDGEPRYWNLVQEEGVWYHADLLEGGRLSLLSDQQMTGYVWDYSAYPACESTWVQMQHQETTPTEPDSTEETQPDSTEDTQPNTTQPTT